MDRNREKIFLKDREGNIIARQVILTLYPDGGMQIKGPSDRDLLVFIFRKAIEAVMSVKPDTMYNGVEIGAKNKGIIYNGS